LRLALEDCYSPETVLSKAHYGPSCSAISSRITVLLHFSLVLYLLKPRRMLS
jgi:hypothetical protein